MSNGPGRGALIGGLVAVLAIAIGVWLMTSEHGGGEATGAAGGTSGTTSHAAAEAPGFKSTDVAQPETLKPTAPAVPAPSGDKKPAPHAVKESPIVAQGKVTWAAGKLPADVDVSLYDADGTELDSDQTQPDGTYALRWDDPLPDGWSVGTDAVQAAFNGQSIQLPPDNVGSLPVHLPGDPPVTADLVLGVPPTITGNVHDRVSGAPLAGAEVSAESSFQAWASDGVDAITDDKGNFTLPLEELPLRGLMVWARHDGYLAQLDGPQDVAPAANPDDTVRLDFALEKAAPWHGHVVSALSGAPVPDATVTVGSDYAALVQSADFEITDENGEFTLDLPEMPAKGAWLHVAVDDGSYAPVALRGIEPGKDIVVRLSPAVTVNGTVLVGGKPVTAADVQVFFDGESFYGDNGLYDEATTDAQGAFSIALEYAPIGNAKLKIDASGCAPYSAKLSEISKPGKAGQLDVTVNLTATP